MNVVESLCEWLLQLPDRIHLGLKKKSISIIFVNQEQMFTLFTPVKLLCFICFCGNGSFSGCLCILVGSTSSSVSDHWLIRLTGDSKRGSVVSRSSTTHPSSIPDSPESPVFFDNGPKEERGMDSCSVSSLYSNVKTKS